MCPAFTTVASLVRLGVDLRHGHGHEPAADSSVAEMAVDLSQHLDPARHRYEDRVAHFRRQMPATTSAAGIPLPATSPTVTATAPGDAVAGRALKLRP